MVLGHEGNDVSMLYLWEKINEQIVAKFLFILRTKQQGEVTYEKVKYVLTVFLGEIEKIVLLFIIFSSLQCRQEFCIAFLAVVSLRIFTGGSHRKTMLGCFLQSFVNFLIIVYCGKKFVVVKWCYILIMLLWIMAIWKIVPIQSINRMQYTKEQRYGFKAKSLTTLMIVQLMEMWMPEKYFNVLIMALIVQLTELLSVQYGRKEGKDDAEKSDRNN